MEDDEEATPWKEQESWEAEHIKKASMQVGAKDRKKAQKEYDLVLPDQIEFITDMVMAGDVVRPLSALNTNLGGQSCGIAGLAVQCGSTCPLHEQLWYLASSQGC